MRLPGVSYYSLQEALKAQILKHRLSRLTTEYLEGSRGELLANLDNILAEIQASDDCKAILEFSAILDNPATKPLYFTLT